MYTVVQYIVNCTLQYSKCGRILCCTTHYITVQCNTEYTAVWRRGQLHMNWSDKWTFNTIQNSKRILLLACAKFHTLQIVEDLPPGLYNPKSLKLCTQFEVVCTVFYVFFTLSYQVQFKCTPNSSDELVVEFEDQ